MYYVRKGFDGDFGGWVAIWKSELDLPEEEYTLPNTTTVKVASEQECREHLRMLFLYRGEKGAEDFVNRFMNKANRSGHDFCYC